MNPTAEKIQKTIDLLVNISISLSDQTRGYRLKFFSQFSNWKDCAKMKEEIDESVIALTFLKTKLINKNESITTSNATMLSKK